MINVMRKVVSTHVREHIKFLFLAKRAIIANNNSIKHNKSNYLYFGVKDSDKKLNNHVLREKFTPKHGYLIIFCKKAIILGEYISS